MLLSVKYTCKINLMSSGGRRILMVIDSFDSGGPVSYYGGGYIRERGRLGMCLRVLQNMKRVKEE